MKFTPKFSPALPRFALICDLETFSTYVNAVVIEVGLVLIDTHNGEILHEHVHYFNQENQNGHYDQETHDWVKANIPEYVYNERMRYSNAVTDNKQSMLDLIQIIDNMLKNPVGDDLEDYAVYGNGSNFDQPILSGLAQRLLDRNNVFKWNFKQELCLRSYTSLFCTKDELKQLKDDCMEELNEIFGRPMILHTALDDARIEGRILHKLVSMFHSHLDSLN